MEETKTENIFVFYDSSLTIDTSYTKALFKAIASLKKKFGCFGNINVLARDEELLSHAKEAGCIAWAIGMESISKEAWRSLHPLFLVFDSDDEKVFERTLEILCDLEVDSIRANILTPFPRTP